MNSLDALNDILELENFLGIPPDEPNCDSYGTVGMTMQEISEMRQKRGQRLWSTTDSPATNASHASLS